MNTITINVTNEKIEQLKKIAQEMSTIGVIAGGSVLDAIVGTEAKDIDIFYPHETHAAKRTFSLGCMAEGIEIDQAGGGYSNVEFAESVTMDVDGTQQRMEFIQKNWDVVEAIELRQTLRSYKEKGIYFSTEYIGHNTYDVEPKDIAALRSKARKMQNFITFGETSSFLSLYADQLINEFDLDIKQVCIDPVSLEIKATPAFVKALQNKMIGFSDTLIESNAITRRNLVRIIHSSMKYGFAIKDEETIRPLFEAMKEYHMVFPSSSYDKTLMQRFAQTTNELYLQPKEFDTSDILDCPFTQEITSVPEEARLVIQKQDFGTISESLFDRWINAKITKSGRLTSIASLIRGNIYTFSKYTAAFNEYLPLAQSELLHSFISDYLYQISKGTYSIEVFANGEEQQRFSTFDAPGTEHFSSDVENHGLAIAIEGVKSNLVEGYEFDHTLDNPNVEYLTYAESISALLWDKEKEKENNMRYDFSKNVEVKQTLFSVAEGLLNFASFESFELARYSSELGKNPTLNATRTALPLNTYNPMGRPSTINTLDKEAIVRAIEDFPEIAQLANLYPNDTLEELVRNRAASPFLAFDVHVSKYYDGHVRPEITAITEWKPATRDGYVLPSFHDAADVPF